VEFVFGGGPLSTLVPGGRVVVVANPAAFESRHGSGLPVAGAYQGRLDNGGERIRLLDPVGEEILDFRYADWFPEADGGGFSMEVMNIGGEPDSWGDRVQWTASRVPGGTPGTSAEPGLTVRLQSGGVVLRFVSRPDTRYRVQVLDSPGPGPWQTLRDLPSSPMAAVIEHVEPVSGSTRFFRVLANP